MKIEELDIFGYTAVIDFLKTNNLSTIIRAHDVQRTGYSEHFMHCKEGRRLPLVVTLFSAPNYCGHYGNEAALLRMEPALKHGKPPEPKIKNDVKPNSQCNSLMASGSKENLQDDLAAPYYPKLTYTRYEWVLDVPYHLPTFENGIQYTLPLIIEKLQNFFEAIDDLFTDDQIPIIVTPPKEENEVEPTEILRLSSSSPPESSGDIPHPPPPRSCTTPRLERCRVVPVSDWLSARVREEPIPRKISDRIKTYETRRVPMVLTSGDAMKRRKSVQALTGSFQNKMKSYLTVVNTSSKFDKIKTGARKSEHRPPVT